MKRFRVQILEERVYQVEVEVDDDEDAYFVAADKAMEEFQDMTPEQGDFSDARAELIEDLETGDTYVP
jgi:hypothetical protein